MIHEHSLHVYINTVAPELNKRQRQVLRVYEDGKGHTDREVAQALGLEINQVTGRIRELIEKEKLFEDGVAYSNGRPSRICKIRKLTLF